LTILTRSFCFAVSCRRDVVKVATAMHLC